MHNKTIITGFILFLYLIANHIVFLAGVNGTDNPLYSVGDELCYRNVPITILEVYPSSIISHQYDAEYQGTILSFQESQVSYCPEVLDFNSYIAKKKEENS